LLCACGDEGKKPLEVEGTWVTQFETTETVSSNTWNSQTIISYSNKKNFAITQNPVDAKFAPSKFNRLVWTELVGTTFYYCTVDFGLESASDAENSTKTADSADLDKGCGTFPWTKMQAK